MKTIFWYASVVSLMLVFSTTAESYISFQWAAAVNHSEVDLDVIHLGHPTYCDSLLYTSSSDAPTDGPCGATFKQKAYTGLFTPAGGWFTSVAYGRRVGSWRIEGSYERNQFSRAQQLLPLAATGDSQIVSKNNEWSQFALPSNWYDDRGTSIVSFDVFGDLITGAGDDWIFYLGGGIGLAWLDFQYGNDFLRKTVEEGYLEVPFPVQWPDSAKRNAAGTLSNVADTVREYTITYSFKLGFDVDISEDTAIGLRLTWRTISDVEHDGAVWTAIRSHAPVIADGQTPFVSDWDFHSYSYMTIGFVVNRRIGKGN